MTFEPLYLKLTEEERIVKAKLKEIMGRQAILKINREPPKPVWYRCGICFKFSICESANNLHRAFSNEPPCPSFNQLGKAWQNYPGSVPLDQTKLINGKRLCPICLHEGHHLQGESNGKYTDCKVTFVQIIAGRWTTVGQCGCFAHQHGVR